MPSTTSAPAADRRGPRRWRRRAGLLAALALLFLSQPAGAGLFRSLAGQAPPDSGAIGSGGAIDSVHVGQTADFGFFFPGELVERLAGGRAALLDVEGPSRPLAYVGPGFGRTALTLDGFPVGGGPVRWEPAGWLPTRALESFRATPGGLSGDGLAGLDAATGAGPLRPSSTVAMTGGNLGHRLAELDFGRVYGRAAIRADVATFKHSGFSAFGPIEQSRGFLRVNGPAAGGRLTGFGQLAAGRNDYFDLGATTGYEETDDSRFGLAWSRPAGGGGWSARLLRESGRLRVLDTAESDLTLDRDRWWGRLERAVAGGGSGRTTLALTAARDRRNGVLADDRALGMVAFGGRHERRFGERAGLTVEIELRDQEPAGWTLDGAARILRGDILEARWFGIARRSLTPAILFHLDRAAPDLARLTEILTRLEGLDRPESHLVFDAGLIRTSADGRRRLALDATAVRSDEWQPPLSTGATAVPLAAVGESRWSGDLRLALLWRPSSTLELGMNGGAGFFRPGDDPWRPRASGEGWLKLRRLYFGGDLDLSGLAMGRLIGERRVPEGAVYPTVVTGRLEVAARVRTLTLFWRMENFMDEYVESDLLDAEGLPIPLPGRHYRLGATLRLLD